MLKTVSQARGMKLQVKVWTTGSAEPPQWWGRTAHQSMGEAKKAWKKSRVWLDQTDRTMTSRELKATIQQDVGAAMTTAVDCPSHTPFGQLLWNLKATSLEEPIPSPIPMSIIKETNPENLRCRWEPEEGQIVTRQSGMYSLYSERKETVSHTMIIVEALLLGNELGNSDEGGTWVGVNIKPNLDSCYDLSEEVNVEIEDAQNKFEDKIIISMKVMRVANRDEEFYGTTFLRVVINTVSPTGQPRWIERRKDALWHPITEHRHAITRTVAGPGQFWDGALNTGITLTAHVAGIKNYQVYDGDHLLMDMVCSIPVTQILDSRINPNRPEAKRLGTISIGQLGTSQPEDEEGVAREDRRKRLRLGKLVGMGRSMNTKTRNER